MEPGLRTNLNSTVSVIDIATNAVFATIPVSIDPLGIAITPGGTRAYVVNYGDKSVSVIDGHAHTTRGADGLPLPVTPQD